MAYKIVLIGGGSYGWTPTLAKDLFLRDGLKGSELVLVDIDPAAAKLLQAYCRMVADKLGCKWKVSVASHEAAMKGADLVCASISTGGFETMHHDYTIPEEFGVYHTVGDTAGPGGISRTLRNVPVFVDFARKMEKLCPNAWMVHVTNPLSQLTRAMARTSSVKCVGLCHNYAGTISFLAKYFGVTVGDVDAVSVGINHYTWLKGITVKGRRVRNSELTLERYLKFEAGRKGDIETGTLDDEIDKMLRSTKEFDRYISLELFERFGYFPVGAAPHVAENFPYYCNSPKTLARHFVRRKGVLPMRERGKMTKRAQLLDVVAGKKPLPDFSPSREGLSQITEALLTGTTAREIVAMPNAGQITNLPKDVVVETHAVITSGGIHPEASGSIPDPLLGAMQTSIDEQELSVEAALTGDRDLVEQAMAVSPMLADKDRAGELADRLLKANRDWLPQFFRKKSPRRKS
jgi:alpha-galactosidase